MAVYVEVPKAKVIKKTQTERSQNNPNFSWRTLVVDITEDPKYPESLAFKFMGNQYAQSDVVNEGDYVMIGGFVKSREWNGKYFTDLNGIKVTVIGDGISQVVDDSQSYVDSAPDFSNGSDDLPF